MKSYPFFLKQPTLGKLIRGLNAFEIGSRICQHEQILPISGRFKKLFGLLSIRPQYRELADRWNDAVQDLYEYWEGRGIYNRP